jgi:adenylate cyclase
VKAKLSLLPVVLACVGALVLVSAGPIIAINSMTSRTIFSELVGRIVVQRIAGLELALRNHLDAARHQADFIVENIKSGALPLGRSDRLEEFAAGSLAAAPQISGLVIADAQGHVIRIGRERFGKVEREWQDLRSNTRLALIDEEARQRRAPYWGPPVYSSHLEATVFNLRAPIWRADEYLGYVAIGISTQALSELALELSEAPRSRVFVLYGGDKVLAHMFLALQPGRLSVDKPLLGTNEVIDPVVRHLASVTPFADYTPPEGIDVGEIEVGDTNYVVQQKPISGYGDTSLIIGAYSDASAVSALLLLMSRAILIGGGVLAAGLVLALVLSRFITRPARRTSEAAAAIAALDFDGAEPLPPSHIREIDNLATSFNAMLVGLKSFGRYVPRTLVKRLIRENRVGAGTEERELTVMFTDIVGFTNTCEGMSPAEVAAFINHHLTLVSRCIEQEGGTIDKYIGDAVMAFWGAPDSIDDPSLRAVRAAAAIQASLAADNERRATEALPPVRIRIGVHCGRLIVGDIGAPDRINYTVIGDVVNAAQRLESLGKEVDAEAESIVLVSRPVKDNVGGSFRFDDLGRMVVKGKRGALEVYRLFYPGAATSHP